MVPRSWVRFPVLAPLQSSDKGKESTAAFHSERQLRRKRGGVKKQSENMKKKKSSRECGERQFPLFFVLVQLASWSIVCEKRRREWMRCDRKYTRGPDSSTDRVPVFGTEDGGSIPSRGTRSFLFILFIVGMRRPVPSIGRRGFFYIL